MKIDRKQAKAAAKQSLKRNYWILVFTCLLTAFFGIAHAQSLSSLRAVTGDTSNTDTVGNADSASLLYEFASGNIGISIDGKKLITDQLDQAQANFDAKKQQSFSLGGLEISYKEGEFAKLANMFSTGSYITTIYKGIHSITGSSAAAVIILIVVSMILRLSLTWFVLNVFVVVMARILLESRKYERIPLRNFFFLLHSKNWLHTAWVLLVKEVYLTLWNLTIIGGAIKNYSYKMVPYILAEQPELTANEAITLSRKMMYGHKLEYFKLQLSFFGWAVLEAFTFGVGGIFFINPYIEATAAEYYAALREQAKEQETENADKLQDVYLFETASPEKLAEAYSDIDQMIHETESFTGGYTGARKFFADIFGIVPRYTEQTAAYDRNEVNKIKISHSRFELEGKVYPTRLSPKPHSPKRDRLTAIFYTRSYSVTSLILMFFTGCFIGWAWEFIYKFIETGNFVNRGVMHGPWLPIYGSGAVMILVMLRKFRRSPLAEFFAAVVLCGIVEYFTAYFLELTHDGQKWWDYSGYFLNIHGRVCAEGLMIFGIGGVAFVYFGAPMLDNLIRRIKPKAAAIVCAVLVTVFAVDFVYSQKHPNQGKGITDYPAAQSSESKAE